MEAKGPWRPWGVKKGEREVEEESPNPHPPSQDNTKCPPNTAPLRRPRGGLWKSPGHPHPGKFSGITQYP